MPVSVSFSEEERPQEPEFCQAALYHRAADYFKQTRQPRASWKTLEDLEPQLAEIELRGAAGEYDAAAEVLTDIDFDYLLLWGHYCLVIALHQSLLGRLRDPHLKTRSAGILGTAYRNIGQARQAIAYYEMALDLAREAENRWGEGAGLGGLGLAYSDLGQTARAIEYYEQALAIAREIGDRRGEGNRLGNLGNAYSYLGQTAHAIEYLEQALAIRREIGDRQGESVDLENLGHALLDVNKLDPAVQSYQQAMLIADEIGFVQTQNYARWGLAIARLVSGELAAARAAIEAARQYDAPRNNHNALALLGLIALRQADVPAAEAAFRAAVAQADMLLGCTAENFKALDAKGLALCGLALCARAGCPDCVAAGAHLEQARQAFEAARRLTAAPGIVKRLQRLLDALAPADPDGLLCALRPSHVHEH